MATIEKLAAVGFAMMVFAAGCGTVSAAGTRPRSTAVASTRRGSTSRPPLPSCPAPISLGQTELPPNNASTATLRLLNDYVRHHPRIWSTKVFEPYQPSNVQEGLARQSPYASDLANACGPSIVGQLWWIATGEPNIPFNQFAKRSPALIINYYFDFSKTGQPHLVYRE
ncbi:hypothetical protein [Sulfobacillus harzensis]|uniref:Uncharacterized protein n=1 Tax=Sulfobacillus harzensis TaxID=2729629 RepID=A0A7Y0L991_9FIRM|nr:hypothetical protein [Sulfobacillus harzensis]NMP24855.1 hypothetical protein [Sulfobacillus harzensis]